MTLWGERGRVVPLSSGVGEICSARRSAPYKKEILGGAKNNLTLYIVHSRARSLPRCLSPPTLFQRVLLPPCGVKKFGGKKSGNGTGRRGVLCSASQKRIRLRRLYIYKGARLEKISSNRLVKNSIKSKCRVVLLL